MTRTSRPRARRALAVFTAGVTVASGAALLGPGTSAASSHREAPYIQGDPAVDNTDTYAFVSPDDPTSVTLVANWLPFQEPAGGPNFFPWDTTAAYDIHIDNNGDARPDLTYRWTFNDVDKRGAQERGKVDGTFLYNDGPVDSLTDPNLLFRQTYDLTVLRAGQPDVLLLNDAPVAPSNVGVASIPDYVKLRKEAVRNVVTPFGDAKSYAGQADDPFYLDLRVFDLLYGGDLSEVGYDTLSGYNVNTIAYKVPKRALVAGNDATANPVIGVWSTTSRQKTRVFADTDAATPQASGTDSTAATTDSGGFVQVSRLGNPLVNEAVVPANLKDYFNRSTPANDGQFLGKVQDPEIPQLIESIYKIPNPNKLEGQTNDDNRNDLVGAFLTGFSKRAFAGETFGGAAKGVVNADLNSLDLNAVSPNPVPAEYLRLNVNVAPKKAGDAGYSTMGVIGGDLSGFPNGRRLGDDVIDIALRVLEGVLLRPDGDLKTAVAGLGDAVNGNERERPLLREFPYIADPHTGSDPRKGQTPVIFQQNFTSSGGVVTASVSRITPAVPGGLVQLYRINADGSTTGLGTARLNAAGTATEPKVFRVPSGTRITLNFRVFPKRGSAAQENRGVPTTITVR
ncbi:MAG TPA: DUF4331 domain-containing protein [Mycobacteriales bacterium]|nr:DUF4331 domain-containing protein [Mycobacteriales bacterium]